MRVEMQVIGEACTWESSASASIPGNECGHHSSAQLLATRSKTVSCICLSSKRKAFDDKCLGEIDYNMIGCAAGIFLVLSKLQDASGLCKLVLSLVDEKIRNFAMTPKHVTDLAPSSMYTLSVHGYGLVHHQALSQETHINLPKRTLQV